MAIYTLKNATVKIGSVTLGTVESADLPDAKVETIDVTHLASTAKEYAISDLVEYGECKLVISPDSNLPAVGTTGVVEISYTSTVTGAVAVVTKFNGALVNIGGVKMTRGGKIVQDVTIRMLSPYTDSSSSSSGN